MLINTIDLNLDKVITHTYIAKKAMIKMKKLTKMIKCKVVLLLRQTQVKQTTILSIIIKTLCLNKQQQIIEKLQIRTITPSLPIKESIYSIKKKLHLHSKKEKYQLVNIDCPFHLHFHIVFQGHFHIIIKKGTISKSSILQNVTSKA